ncbi:hypothetical protein EDD85DRAFT_794157 [Armillaria nabsnona]|nr:hypothetical protein EDD85DRAFT_794157 [Armillaria nabsnona]
MPSSEQRTSHRRPFRVFCCLVTTLSFVIIVPTLCIALGIKLRPGGDLSYTKSLKDETNTDRMISLRANLVSADIRKTTMIVECKVTIFFDTYLSPSDSQDHGPYNSNKPATPMFIWNATNSPMSVHDYDPRNKFPIFHTNLIVYDRSFESSHASLVYYPFDSGLKITTDVGSKDVAYSEDVKPEKRVIDVTLTIRRSALVVAYCLVITLTIWLVTLMICCIMISTVIFGFRQRNEIVVVPVGTVFAFTQLRSSMSGAPDGFDFAGIFPCLILLSISAVTMVGIYLFVNPDDPARRPFTRGEIARLRDLNGYGMKRTLRVGLRDCVSDMVRTLYTGPSMKTIYYTEGPSQLTEDK